MKDGTYQALGTALLSLFLSFGALAQPEINIQGNGMNIVDGSTTISTTIGTDYGITTGSTMITYTIQNTGSSVLTINDITLSGTHFGDYSLGTLPTTVAASGSETFTVTFTPTGSGDRDATVTVDSDDSDEMLYDFAIQGVGPSPAGLSTNLNLWLKADAGVSTSGSDVTAWTDQSAQGNNASQGVTGNQPDLETSSINGNSVIDFDGTDDYLDIASTVGTDGGNLFSVFVVFRRENSSDNDAFLGGGSSAGDFVYQLLNSPDNQAVSDNANNFSGTATFATSAIGLTGLVRTAGNNFQLYSDGVTDGSAGSIASFGSSFSTNNLEVGRSTANPFNGDIAEIIMYSEAKTDPTELSQIQSYLAIKYGITIDQGSATDYLASDGGTIWDGSGNMTYNSDIAGIGRDDNSALDQRSSASINSGAIVTIANGDLSSPASFSADDSFVIWGHDGNPSTFGTDNLTNGNGTTSNRMNRIWRVDETGTVGSVEISISNALVTGDVSIVVHPSNATFPADADRQVIDMRDNGSDYEATVDFSDGDFFSFINASEATVAFTSVVINEVITDPQQDWSSGGFFDISPGGTAGSDDEWIELYIAEAGLNLTNWTIALNNNTSPDVAAASLSAGGAFDISNYLSTSGGSFTSTAVGDYLILGTVGSSGVIDDIVTVTLTDGSTTIDEVILDGGSNAPSGAASGNTDESVARIPNGNDTNVDQTDFIQTRTTLGTANSPTGMVVINEVVTDPQQDWSSISFNGAAPGGSGGTDDEWVELYIASDGINLAGWTIELIDGSDVIGDLTSSGAFEVTSYVPTGGGSFVDTRIGDYLVLGDVAGTGTLEDDILITLKDASGTTIDEVELGDDPAADGAGDGAPDGSANGGDANTVDDESIVRYPNATDTDNDVSDFLQTIATLGSDNSPTGTVVINEVVTEAIQDWSTNGFNGTSGGSTVSEIDEWVELYITTAGINLTGWTIELIDGTNFSGDLTNTGAFETTVYTGSGSFINTAVGDFLVLGDPTASEAMDNNVQIILRDASNNIVDQVQLGGGGGQAPDGNSTDESDESVSRIPNGTDTDNDAADFEEVPVSMGANNSRTPLAAIGNALDFDNTDDFVQVLDDDNLSFGDGTADVTITIEAWVNMNSLASNTFVAKWSATEEEFQFGTDGSGDLQAIFADESATATISNVATSATLTTSTWTHVAVTYDATEANTGITLYIDGVDVTETLGSSGTYTAMENTAANLNIASLDGSGNFMDGLIDELRIWNDVRTQEEILENMNTTVDPVVEPNLLAYYRFDRSSGLLLSDVQSGGYDGTLEASMTDADWVTANWDVFAENAVELTTAIDATVSGEVTVADVSFLNDAQDFLLFGHDAIDFLEVQTDLPTGTLVSNRYSRTWHATKNDAVGTADGRVTISFNLGATPDDQQSYYLIERPGTSGTFSIVPVQGIQSSGTSVTFTLDASQIDDDSYYTIGRSDAGPGNGLDFDDTSGDLVNLGDVIDDAGLTAITIEGWVRPTAFPPGTTTSDIRTIISKGDIQSTTGAFGIYFIGDGSSSHNLVFEVDNGTTKATASVGVTGNISLNTWQHITLTWSATNSVNGYINGALVASSATLSGTIDDIADDLIIGSGINANEDLFQGEIDEIRIWDVVRTQDELINNFFQNIEVTDADIANLVGYYRFNQGIGNSDTNLPDHSGDNNTGTLTNFDNLNMDFNTETSNYVNVTNNGVTPALNRNSFDDNVVIINLAGVANDNASAASDELTISSTIETAGFFLADNGDFIAWGNDDGAFSETGNDVPAGTLVTNRIEKTWHILKNDESGTADGNVTFSFDLGAAPDPDFTYYLIERSGTSGNFSVVEVIGSEPNGNSIEFTVDASQVTNDNFVTLGRSGSGQGNTLDFDETDDYVSATDNSTLDITGDLTLEAWVNLASAPGATAGIVSKHGTAGQRSYALAINSSNQPTLIVSSDGTSTTTVTSAVALSTNTWTHVAGIFDANDDLTLYINGVPVAQNTISIPSAIFNSTTDLWIGAITDFTVANNLLDGAVDEVRIWSDIRTDNELIQNLHRSLDVANEGNLAAYYKFNQGIAAGTNTSPDIDLLPDHSLNDNSGNLNNFGLTGTTTNWISSEAVVSDAGSAQALIGPGNALDFDGNSNYVSISDAATFDITGTLTIEAWLNLGTTPPSANEGVVSKFLTAGNQESYTLDITTGGNAQFIVTADGSTDVSVTGSTTIPTGSWTHLAAVFTPSTSLQIYVNGVLDGELTTGVPATLAAGTADVWIGQSSVVNPNNAINGSIDEVRFWNTARTDTEIQDNMFKELTGGESGLAAYYRFDELDDNSSTTLPNVLAGNIGTLTNMPTPSTNWISAAAREPFKTTNAGNYQDDTTWKTRAEPNASSAILDIAHNITLSSGNLSADVINVNSGNTLTIGGSQSITTDNNIINNGAIAGAGSLVFDGSGSNLDLIITGGTFSNINLTDAGVNTGESSQITLQGNITVTGTLDLDSDGNLDNSNIVLGDFNLTVNSLSSFSSNHYIQTINQNSSGGFLTINIAQSDGQIIFPVFSNTSYTPVTILNLGTTGNLNARVFDDVFANGTSGSSIASGDEVNKTWEITGDAGVNVTLTFQWNSGDEGAGFNTHRTGANNEVFVGKNEGTFWFAITPDGAAEGAGPFTRSASGITTFSSFGVAALNSPLPIELTGFQASVHEGKVFLDWQTATEIDNDHFEIQRSVDGENFEMIGTHAGAGNSSHIIDYSFVDVSPFEGMNYYRLKQVDFDGEHEYSNVVSAKVDFSNSTSLLVYPNPFKDVFTIEFEDSLPSNSSLKIMNISGGTISQTTLIDPTNRIRLDLGSLNSGIYFLQIEAGNRVMIERLSKQ